MRLVRVGLFVWIALTSLAVGQSLPTYTYEEAAKHVGQKAIVKGRIIGTRNTGTICFLNFHPNYREHLSLVIYGENFAKFPTSPETLYKDKDVEVTGFITQYQGRPQIIVSDPSEIKIVVPAAAPAPGVPGAAPSTATFNAAAQVQAPPSNAISWKDAHRRIGEDVVVEGKIVDTRNIGNVCFLNFHEDYQTYLTGVVAAENFASFPGAPERLYIDKHVRIKGRIELFRGKPQINIASPAQIEVIAAEQALAADALQPAVTIGYADAGKYIGTRAAVEGTILRAFKANKAIFFSFDPGNKQALSLVLFENDLPLFPSSPETHYLYKKVRVTGLIQSYKGAPEIVLNSPKQIEILNAPPGQTN